MTDFIKTIINGLKAFFTTNLNKAKSALEEQIGEVQEIAESAESTAVSMKVQVSRAQSVANDAYTLAEGAQSTANTAQSTANTAQSTANTAQSTANTAQSTANTARNTADAAYKKPDSGIPKTDLTAAVQASLGKADDALPKSGGTITGPLHVNGGMTKDEIHPNGGTFTETVATEHFAQTLGIKGLSADDTMKIPQVIAIETDPNGGNGIPLAWKLVDLPSESLSIMGATVGQTIKVKAVDDDGKPTEWEAVDMQPLTIAIGDTTYTYDGTQAVTITIDSASGVNF